MIEITLPQDQLILNVRSLADAHGSASSVSIAFLLCSLSLLVMSAHLYAVSPQRTNECQAEQCTIRTVADFRNPQSSTHRSSMALNDLPHLSHAQHSSATDRTTTGEMTRV